MKRRGRVLWLGITMYALQLLLPGYIYALDAPALVAPAGLSFVEIKPTGDEFLILQNNTSSDIPDLSRYALYYFNNVSPLTAGTTTTSQMLPATPLLAGEAIMLTSVPRPTCGAAVAGDLTISLGDSAGFLQLVELAASDSGAILQTPGDVVSWSSGSAGMIQNIPSNSKDPLAVFYRYQRGDTEFGWQYANLGGADVCQLQAIVISGTTKTTTPTDVSLITSNDTVPGVIVKLMGGGTGTPGPIMPAANLGLKAPKVSELLANVKSPAKDAEDEFIELYNPNTKAFDLSGFILQSGSTTSETRHNYIIPRGTTIQAKGFKTFYSRETKLSLNNTGGQVWLLDPFRTPIGQSDPYAKPKDGTSWATANGKWYHTTTPTPGAANKITEVTAGSSASSSKTAKTSKGTPVTALAATTSGVAGSSSASAYEAAASTVPIHPGTLAIVLGLGLLYGSYEYRHDLANKIHQLRTYRARRR